MLNGLKEKFWRVAETRGINRAITEFRPEKGWLILCGHGICDGPLAMNTPDDRYIQVATFKAEMEHLLSLGYRFVTLTEGIRRMREGESLDNLVTMTFDDGMHSVVEFAYPVMVALGVKGCMYVVPGIVGTSRILWTDMIIAVCWHRQGEFALHFPQGRISYAGESNRDPGKTSLEVIHTFRTLPEEVRKKCFEQIERMYEEIPEGFVPREYLPVTWDELRSLDPGILEVGNHTLSHPKLVNVDGPTMQSEITEARRMIADELGTPVDHFCYPGGSYDLDVVECVRSAGHASATTGFFGRNTRETSAFELRRVVISPTLARFQSRMSGFERLVRTLMKPGRLLRIVLIVLGAQAGILAASAA